MEKKSTKLDIACTLDAAGLRQRRGPVWDLVNRASERRELKNGFEFCFASPTSFGELVEIVELERNCCKFLRFVITAEPNDGPLRLEISGPDGTKEYLVSLLASYPPR